MLLCKNTDNIAYVNMNVRLLLVVSLVLIFNNSYI